MAARRCAHVREDGSTCKAWARKDGDLCHAHADPDAWARQTQVAIQRASAARIERAAHTRPLRHGKRERYEMTLGDSERVSRALGPLLDASLPDGEPWMERRALAALVALLAWRTRPEALAVLWDRLAPRAPMSSAEIRRLDLERAQAALADALEEARRDGSLADIPDWLTSRVDILLGRT